MQWQQPSLETMQKLVDLFRVGDYDRLTLRAKGLASTYPAHPFGWKVLGSALVLVGRP